MAGTHGPIEPTQREVMNRLGRMLDLMLGPRVHWTLLVFPVGSARANYISNAERSSMLEAMKELVARFEGTHPEERPMPDDKPDHPHGGPPGQTGDHPQGGPPGQQKPRPEPKQTEPRPADPDDE